MTIEFTEVKRTMATHIITGVFIDTDTGLECTNTFLVKLSKPSTEEINDAIKDALRNAEFILNPLNDYDLTGDDIKVPLRAAVQHVRDNPNCTFAELRTAVEASCSDVLWNINKLIPNIKTYLEMKIGQTFTFNEFKNYVLNHKFKGVDDI